MIFLLQSTLISCSISGKYKNPQVILLEQTESELREVSYTESEDTQVAFIGKYILTGMPYMKTERSALGSLNRQYYKITEKVFDNETGEWLNIDIPDKAKYAVPEYATDNKTPLFITGIPLFDLKLKCINPTETVIGKLEFNMEDQDVKSAIENAFGSSYPWETFNKFEIQFIEECGEEYFWFNKDAFSRKAKAIWYTEYKGVPVENRLEVTLQFADIVEGQGLVFWDETSVVEVEYTNAFLYLMGHGMQPDLYNMKIDIPTEKELTELFNNAIKYVPITNGTIKFPEGMLITSYEGYPCIYVPVLIDSGITHATRSISMIIFI